MAAEHFVVNLETRDRAAELAFQPSRRRIDRETFRTQLDQAVGASL